MSGEPLSLPIEPLTKAAFAPFGTVIEAEGAERLSINQGTTERFHALAQLDVGEDGGIPILSIFKAQARAFPIQIVMMERHPLSSQAFFPLSFHDWLVVVSTQPHPKALRAFLARGDQGVQYARGVWHHPLLVMQPQQDFLVADRAGSGDNLQEHWFSAGQAAYLAHPRQTA
ncbi:MAG: ureidoglycolate lyase [Pseudomonadota bacterium]